MKKQTTRLPAELSAANQAELSALEAGRDALRAQLTEAITKQLREQGGEVQLRKKTPSREGSSLMIVRAFLRNELACFVGEFGSSHHHCFQYDTDTLLLIYKALLPA